MEVPSGVSSALIDIIQRGVIEGHSVKSVAQESRISGYSLLTEL